jgi:hypothetical protein
VHVDTFLWGVVPAAVAICSVAASIICTARRPSAAQVLLSLVAIAFAGASLYVLKVIFLDGAWPTFLPHIGVGVAAAVATMQVVLDRRQVRGTKDTAPDGGRP